ncbi:MAG TPA: type IV pilin-like G/H family protein [Trichocoleus sp.]
MKSTLKAKLIQHLIGKKEEGGFTLIELLVVIIIIGILAAIALPAFLNQANRARQSEATTYVGSINRGQQAYRLENRTFANRIDLLGLGIQSQTEYYTYGNGGTQNTVTAINGGTLANSAFVNASPRDEALLGYTGFAYTLRDTGGNSTTTALLCTSSVANTVPAGTLTGPGVNADVNATGTNTQACL